MRDACLAGSDLGARLSNRIEAAPQAPGAAAAGGIERIADVPIYFADPLVRRAESLQQHGAMRARRAPG